MVFQTVEIVLHVHVGNVFNFEPLIEQQRSTCKKYLE
jgi:hypothetical protein